MARLDGMKVAVLVTDGFEQVELTEPKKALEKEGATVHIISDKSGKVLGMKHIDKADEFDVDKTLDQADPGEYGGVLLPGGVVNADALRIVPAAQKFLKAFADEGRPIAVICHGAWLMVSAGVVEGHTLTSWPTLQDDIRNAGGTWVDQEVCVDSNWVSSRKPDDLPAFNEQMVEIFSRANTSHAAAVG